MSSNAVLWATAVIMLAGGLVILATGRRRTSSEMMQTVLHGIVPIIAACLYLAMASGQGQVVLPTTDGAGTRLFYYARYVDWTVTTPLLLLSLGLSATHTGQKRPDLLMGAILADVIMIGTAFAFGASELSWTKWTWFIISCIAFLGVYYVIWLPQMQANALERADVRRGYKRDATILSVLWLIYPLILAVAPDGLGILSDASSVLLIAILDVVSKVAYGLLTVASDAKITERDLTESNPPIGRAALPAE